MNTNNIKIQGIDKDFVYVIDKLVGNGFKPWASCDGVKAHHTPEKNKRWINSLYIAS